MVVENAFGRLKGRWRCLLRIDCNLNNTSDIVASCIVLHNICEMYGDGCLEEWTHHDDSSSSSVPSSHTNTSVGTSDAALVRDAIMNHLSA